mmetsp:Transcript_12709/g.19585  ORF Transcript_12709/g.19585 Transcript_12709/m.19585 type:complete len:96 (-) Transcript_12709:2192-2479(-)
MCQVVGRDVQTFPPHERMWLRNVFTESPGSLGVCTDADELFEPRHVECVRDEEQAVDTDKVVDIGVSSEQPSSANQVGFTYAFFTSMVLMWTVYA